MKLATMIHHLSGIAEKVFKITNHIVCELQ